MKRRTFLEVAGLGLANTLVPRAFSAGQKSQKKQGPGESAENTFGSGHFGTWNRDSHGLPSYHYTCNQLTDPKAVQPVDKAWRSPTDHIHQVGNDRIIAIASNYGHVQVRQDEGSPKFLNDYSPDMNRHGAGIGFLADDNFVLSTFYTGKAESFDRIFGIGYVQKHVTANGYSIDQVIFAPYGDDPVLLSQVTITNRSAQTQKPRWVEYWGCQNYQFSYRSLMESGILGGTPDAVARRHDFAERFTHHFQKLPNGKGLIETQTFLGRATQEEEAWQQTQASLKAKPTGFFGGPTPKLAPNASMDDLTPPSTFLASLDAPADGYTTDANHFFQNGIEHPHGMSERLDNNHSAQGAESAFFLERQLVLKPGESRTLYFLYGYLPEGFSAASLIAKYSADPATNWSRSSAQWRSDAPMFRTQEHPWIEREAMWNNYYLRSGFTYDSFFHEHILSQGASYQYLAGLQCAARDPLQHVLPFIFTNPKFAREVIRYTLKEIQPDGSLPYGIVGAGVPMPCVYQPSDLQLWVLWVVSEYVLATRDLAFLDERIPVYPRQLATPDDPTIFDLLQRSFTHCTTKIGTGKHGLLRLFNGDWNDSIVYSHLTPEQVAQTVKVGESVLNSTMATYVFDYYAQLLDFLQHPNLAQQARAKAAEQREAVQAQWHGQWYRRAWLGEELGWMGEKQMWLEPQPWALLGNCVPQEKIESFVSTINDLVRKPSQIGAILQSEPDPTMKNQPGVGTNGGIFIAVNATLIWALASVDGKLAWDEWMKNTLAHHADTYPDMWFGIWSGPDAYYSSFSKYPGGTGPDLPILNMHAHAWPLYTVVKLLGTEFRPDGIHFKPVIPLDTYEFQSQLFGFRKTSSGYSGWYLPTKAGRWNIEIDLPKAELARHKHLSVNGTQTALHVAEGKIRINGNSSSGTALRWQIS